MRNPVEAAALKYGPNKLGVKAKPEVEMESLNTVDL